MAARIVPSKIFAVVTASAAISAARIVPSKIFAVVTASVTIATDPVLSIVTAPDNATAAALPLVQIHLRLQDHYLRFNAVST
jgi:hypothetical protein